MDIGSARVSTGEQTLDLHLDALRQAGCHKVFEETVSGAKADRPVLAEARSSIRAGNTFVVWRFDRLGRSLEHLIASVTTSATDAVIDAAAADLLGSQWSVATRQPECLSQSCRGCASMTATTTCRAHRMGTARFA